MNAVSRTTRARRLARATHLLLAGLPLWVATQAAQAQGSLDLPPEPLLHAALLQAPETAAASAGLRASQAAATQLRLGPDDWVLRAGIARRSERGSAASGEREIALERSVRWGSKAAQDATLAEQTLRLAGLQQQAAWQAAAGVLVAQWFDALREQQTAWHQQQQWQLAQAQVTALQRRVAAGDAAPLLLRLAEGELARTGAARAGAEQRAATSRQALLRRHPALAPAWPAAGAASTANATAAKPAADDGHPASGTPDVPGTRAGADTVGQLLARHPALAIAQAEQVLARLQLQRLEADRQPDPTLGLRFAQDRSGAGQVLGLTVSVPFGPALRDSRVQAGQAALDAAEARLRGLQQQLATDAEQLAAAPGQTATVLQRLRAAAHAADLSTSLTRRAHAAGEASLAELLQQQRQAGDAALAADITAIDLLQARARLQLALQHWLPAPRLP